MYGALIVLSVPMPLVAGWLSDRIGRQPVIIGVYVGGAIGFVVFLAGRLVASPGCGSGSSLMGLFCFAESPQLQALLADVAAPDDPRRLVRPLLHARVRGRIAVDRALRPIIEAFGEATGLPIVFGLMAVSFLLAALAVVPIRERFRGNGPPGSGGRARGRGLAVEP